MAAVSKTRFAPSWPRHRSKRAFSLSQISKAQPFRLRPKRLGVKWNPNHHKHGMTPIGGWAACELWQQTILKSTLLVTTTEELGGNTQFSAQLHNQLTTNTLSQQERYLPSTFNIPRCETCLTEGRNTVFRTAKHGLSRCG